MASKFRTSPTDWVNFPSTRWTGVNALFFFSFSLGFMFNILMRSRDDLSIFKPQGVKTVFAIGPNAIGREASEMETENCKHRFTSHVLFFSAVA